MKKYSIIIAIAASLLSCSKKSDDPVQPSAPTYCWECEVKTDIDKHNGGASSYTYKYYDYCGMSESAAQKFAKDSSYKYQMIAYGVQTWDVKKTAKCTKK